MASFERPRSRLCSGRAAATVSRAYVHCIFGYVGNRGAANGVASAQRAPNQIRSAEHRNAVHSQPGTRSTQPVRTPICGDDGARTLRTSDGRKSERAPASVRNSIPLFISVFCVTGESI